MTSVDRTILLTIADMSDYFPLTKHEREELRERIKYTQDWLFRAWDRMVKENPELAAEGTWPHLERLKEETRVKETA